MKREAVAYVAAFAAAVSVGALGYAVVWGLDPSEPALLASPPEATRSEPPRRVPPVVLTPSQPGQDTERAFADPGTVAPVAGDAVSSAVIAPPDEVSALPPRRDVVVVAPPQPGEDARPQRDIPARMTDPAVAKDSPLPSEVRVSALIPETGEPIVETPAVAPQPEPTSTAEPPPGQGHVIVIPRKRVALPPGALPRSALLPVEAPQILRRPAVRPNRVVRPMPPVPQPRQAAPLGLSPPGVVVMRGVPAVPVDPPGVMVVRGVPPVPENSLVPSGPLIITLPASRRR